MENNNLKNEKINKWKKIGRIICYIFIVSVWLGVVVLWFFLRGCSMLSASAETSSETEYNQDALWNDTIGGLDSSLYNGVAPCYLMLNGLPMLINGSTASGSANAPYGHIGSYMDGVDGYAYSVYKGDYTLSNPMAVDNLYGNIFTISAYSTLMDISARRMFLAVSDELSDGSYQNTIYAFFCNSRGDGSAYYLNNATLYVWTTSFSDVAISSGYLEQYLSVNQNSLLTSHMATKYIVNASGDGISTAVVLPVRNDIVNRTYSFLTSNIDVTFYWYEYSNSGLWNTVDGYISKNILQNRSLLEQISSNIGGGGGNNGGIDYEWAYNDLLGRYQELNNRYDSLLATNSALNSQLASLQVQIDSLTAEVGSFGLQTQQYKDRIASLESELNGANQLKNYYSAQVEFLEDLIHDYEVDYEYLPMGFNSIESYNVYVEELNDDLVWYKTNYERVDREYQTLDSQFQDLLDSIENDINKDSASYKNGYSQGYRDGKSYEEGKAFEDQETIKKTLIGMISAPVDFFSEVLNFSILGVNVFDFLTAIITLLLTVWVIKTFI